MEREYKITESSSPGKEKAIHHIKIADGDKRGGWYRQVLAMEGLHNRGLNRWYHHWYIKHHKEYPDSSVRFRRYDGVEERMLQHLGVEREKPLEVHHDSIWDFMDYIGYDHKDKKVSNTDKHLIVGIGL